jgi:hypothetical protein
MTRETSRSISDYARRMQNLHRLAKFIASGHVDTSEAHGNAATRVLIGEPASGQWAIPLAGGIDMVNRADAIRLEMSVPQVDIFIGNEAAELYISWDGADGQLRKEPLELDHARFMSPDQSL